MHLQLESVDSQPHRRLPPFPPAPAPDLGLQPHL